MGNILTGVVWNLERVKKGKLFEKLTTESMKHGRFNITPVRT